LKTNLKLPVFLILKGNDTDQQNTVSRLQKRISAVPGAYYPKRGSSFASEVSPKIKQSTRLVKVKSPKLRTLPIFPQSVFC